MKKKRLNAEYAEDAQRAQPLRQAQGEDNLMLSLSKHALSFWRLPLIAVLTVALAGCGTKTELLKPDGKPTPRDERDPSQPPSSISR